MNQLLGKILDPRKNVAHCLIRVPGHHFRNVLAAQILIRFQQTLVPQSECPSVGQNRCLRSHAVLVYIGPQLAEKKPGRLGIPSVERALQLSDQVLAA